MRIRKAREKDLDSLVSLWWQMHTSHYQYDKAYYKLAAKRKACAASRKHLKEMISNKNAVFLVAEENDTLLGSLLAHIVNRPPVFPPQKRALLDNVVVDEKHRGKGIYSKLQKRFDKIAKDKGAIYIELNVDISSSVVEIYKRKGYSARHLKMIKKLK
jgi:GNAT superfamily N-acetyltransferase